MGELLLLKKLLQIYKKRLFQLKRHEITSF